MPLAPELQMFLNFLPPAPAQRPSIEQARAQALMGAQMLPRRPVVIGGTRDISIPGPASALPARVYTPVGSGPSPSGGRPAEERPLVAFFHGGGFVAYSIETHDQLCRELCAGSGAVVSVEYRLAPEFKFPQPVDDAHAAVRWLAEHAHELGADASRLAVAGDSAGASLSLAAALRLRDEGGPPLRAQLLIYPAADMSEQTEYPSRTENGSGYLLTQESMEYYGRMYLASPEDATHPHASPLHSAQLAGLPPTLVLTAEYDPLRDEGRALVQKLRAAGVDAGERPGPGLIHGFANLTALVPSAARIVDDAAAWLKEQLN